MFHFLVVYGGWEQSQGSFDISRVFEYTDPNIKERFAHNGYINVDEVKKIPALFAAETDSEDEQLAKIGYITNITTKGRDIHIGYFFDQNIPPISNEKLEQISDQLGIQAFEFSRTHWSIKNVDLFKVLYSSQITSIPSAQVFSLDAIQTVEEDLISLMMPFSSNFSSIYESVKSMADSIRMRCLRADDIWKHNTVIQDVVTLICKSRIVICDCTGKNPNVFYEAGIAHTLGKDVILLTQSEDDIPFDLRHIRYLKYLNNEQGREEMVKKLRQRVETLLGGRN